MNQIKTPSNPKEYFEDLQKQSLKMKQIYQHTPNIIQFLKRRGFSYVEILQIMY